VVGDEMMLNLSQACVGVEAKDEWNVVDVETFSRTGDRVQHTLLQLRGDHMPHCQLSVLLSSEATFKLVKGSGPVHLTGEERISLGPQESDDSDEETVEQMEQAVTKITGSNKAVPPAAVIKSSAVKDSGAGKQAAGKLDKNKESLIHAESEEGDEEDSEEESEDDDDIGLMVEDEEGSDNEDDSEEDEEVEEQSQPPSKKQKMAIQSKVRRLQPISKNVLSQEKQRKPEKQSKPGKKQGQGKSLAAPGRPDTEQVKARLMQVTSLHVANPFLIFERLNLS
jgi:hypothetical protein